MSVPYPPGKQRDLGFSPCVLHITPLFLSPPQQGTPSTAWFALKNVGRKKKKICSLWRSLALELFDLTNHISQQRKHWRQCPFPGQRLIPRGVPAAAAARGADPSFPSCCSRHFSTPGDRRAPGKRGRVRDVTAESGMLGQRCSKCAVPWK